MEPDTLSKIKSLIPPTVAPPKPSQKASRRKRRRKDQKGYSTSRKSVYYTEDDDGYVVPTFFPVEEDHPEWQVITTAKVNDIHFVTKYRSRSTGMELIHATVQGPTVHCYITLATKAENDEGIANIVRNLVYMGSEDYPYAEILHTLTAKCLASASISYTEIDHTCYTITTAGGEGIVTLLPIHLDHIFFPLLTEASYLTEIYHVNANGEDAGPLYKYLMKENNLPDVKIKLALNKAVYNTSSSYQYQYLGLPENLRQEADIHKVREYHKKYYVPMNTCMTICGQVDPLHIFEALAPTLHKLVQRGRAQSPTCAYEEEWTKPWLAEKLLEFDHPLSIPIRYPSVDEEFGTLVIGFVGPQVIYSTEHVVAMRLMMEYLVWGNFSPLVNAFVNSSAPLAGGVKFIELCHMKSIFAFQFEKIRIKNMDDIVPRFTNVLKSQLEEFDEERMLDVIHYCCQREVSILETEPHDTIAGAISKDFCYATSDDGLLFDRRVNNSYTIQQFVHQPKSFWVKVLSKGILNQPWITIDCLPSTEELIRIETEEDNRRIERVTNTPEELEAMGHRLDKAFKRKKACPPKEVLDAVKPPSVRHMGFHNIHHQRNPEWAEDFKCNLLIDDIQSGFVYVTVLMDSSSLDAEQKKYLVLFIQAILRSPILDDESSKILSREEIATEIETDILVHNLYLGIPTDGITDPNDTIFTCGSYAHNLCLTMQLQISKVENGFQWIRKLLWNTVWDKDVLKKLVDEMIGKVNEIKNDGRLIIKAMLMDFLYKYDSNVKSSSCVRQQALLKNISENFYKESDDLIIMLESIRKIVLQPRNMTVHIATNINKLEFQLQTVPQEKLVIYKLLRRTFKNFYTETVEEDDDEQLEKRICTTADTAYMKNFVCIKSWAQELILRSRNKDPLSYLIQATPCVKSFTDPEYPIVLLACTYFAQREGPFTKQIISAGLAEDCTLQVTPFNGMVTFMLNGCPDIVEAYNVAFDIILSHLNEGNQPPVNWEETLFEGARSTIIFNLISYENTPRNLAMQSLHNNVRDLSVEFSRNFVEAIVKVTLNQVKMMTKKYLRELFVENISCAVAAPAEKVPSVIKEFTNYAGKRFSLMSEIDQSFLSRW